tara:strand:- start:537 stop:1058 length:522 start_codon:yes stop_codon:yes gene_type:complete
LKNKKAAIELSMTTIIIIIVGVTLLSLGLMWINNIFGEVDVLTDDAFSTARKVVQQDMAPDDSFYVSGYTIEAKKGKMTTFYAGIQFSGSEDDTADFKINAKAFDEGGNEINNNDIKFILPPETEIKAGEVKGFPIGIKIGKNVAKGTVYSVIVKAEKDGSNYEEETLIIEVT